MTNAERIRQMTDEELAFYIICPYVYCQKGPYVQCKNCVLEWLREEANDDKR